MSPPSASTDRMAPDGFLWVCRACGKTATDRYGIEGAYSPGWDESCILNSDLFAKVRLTYGPDKRVMKVTDWEPTKTE